MISPVRVRVRVSVSVGFRRVWDRTSDASDSDDSYSDENHDIDCNIICSSSFSGNDSDIWW
jgi:hypothetical protein